MTDTAVWYIGINGQQQGPMSAHQVYDLIRVGHIPQAAYVYGLGLGNWTPITGVPAFAPLFHVSQAAPPPPPVQAAPTLADQIDYEIFGEEAQFVEITLDPGEAVVGDAGAFFYMDPGMEMETISGDGPRAGRQSGFMATLMEAGKRLITGESLFMTIFGNGDESRRRVAFAGAGKIVPVDLREHGGVLLCEKDAFLCAAKGIAVSMGFQKQLGTRSFILQKLEGQGLAFVLAGGAIAARDLKQGESIRVEIGGLIACQASVGCDIQWMSEVRSAMVGGEHVYMATLTGPGRVWLQSLPAGRLAGRALGARRGGA